MPSQKNKLETPLPEPAPKWLTVFLLALGALAFRLYNITSVSFWHNEALTAAITRLSWADFVSRLPEHPVSGLYYLLIKIWSIPFGTEELALRGFSAIFGALVVVMIFQVVRKIFNDNKLAYLSAGLVTVSPLQIQYSQTAQGYTISLFFGLIATIFLVSALELKRLKSWFGFGLMLILSLAASPSILNFSQELNFLQLNFAETINTFWQMLFGGFGTNRIVAGIGTLLILTALFFFYRNTTQTKRWLVALIFVASATITLLTSSRFDLDAPIALLISSLALIIITARAITAIPNYSIRQVTSLVLVLFSIFMLFKNWSVLNPAEKPGTKAAIAYVNDYSLKNDFIFTNNPYTFFPVSYYSQTSQKPLLVYPQSNYFSGNEILTENDQVVDWSLPQPNQNAWVIWSRGFQGNKPVVPGNWELITEKFYPDAPDHKGMIVVSHYHIK